MKTVLTIILSVGLYTAYGQYDYVPQIPVDALYRNLQYKQQLYDQRKAQLQERVDYSYSLIKRLNPADFDAYLNSLNENLKTINHYDITDTDVFYDVLNWFNRFDEKVKARIP